MKRRGVCGQPGFYGAARHLFMEELISFQYHIAGFYEYPAGREVQSSYCACCVGAHHNIGVIYGGVVYDAKQTGRIDKGNDIISAFFDPDMASARNNLDVLLCTAA